MNRGDRRMVLVVEDNRDAREALRRLLSQEGFAVAVAASGLEASQYLHSGVSPPDMVLVDLLIPDPPGQEIVRLIRDMGLLTRRARQPVRVVVYTGNDAEDEAVQSAIRAGADAVIVKPSTIDRTVAVLRGDDPGDVPLTPPPATPGDEP